MLRERCRTWVIANLFSLFFFTGLLLVVSLGVIPSIVYYSAPYYSFQPTFSGFGVARNETYILPYMMVVGIGIDPPEIWFQYFFQYSMNGTYNFIFIFPFYIPYVDSTHARIGRSRGNLSFFDVHATSQGSAVGLQLQVNDVNLGWEFAEIWGQFSINNTFQSGTRGSYLFLLPFGMGIHSDVYQDLWQRLKVGFHTPDTNITLQVGLPSHYQITQTFPPLSSGPNTWKNYFNRTITTVEWEFQRLQNSVTIYCQNPSEISFYQSLLFASGLGFGIGVPVVITTIYDKLREISQTSDAIRKHDDKNGGKCPKFYGYLGTRAKNCPIPDFCLTCHNLLKCMAEDTSATTKTESKECLLSNIFSTKIL